MDQVLSISRFNGGISDATKEGLKGAYAFAKRLDIRSDPNQATILPATAKRSGSTVTDLVKWIVSGENYSTDTFFYDASGNFYKEAVDGTWTLIGTVPSSHGQGMDLYNDYVYLSADSTLSRYGPLSGVPVLTNNWQTGLNATTDFAPILRFRNGFLVGHGNYVGWYDGSTWDADKLVLPPGVKVRCIEQWKEFATIGTWTGANVYDNNPGYIFLWDGLSTNTTAYFKVTAGGVNAIVNLDNRLVSIVGKRALMQIGMEPFQRFQEMPYLERGKYAEVFPGAVCVWNNLVYAGIAGNTDSSAIIQGVYAYGTKEEAYPEVLSYDHTASTATETGTTLKIGAVKGVGNYLYISWRDGSSYGVDRVSISGTPYSSGDYLSLLSDDGRPHGEKLAKNVKASHLALATGETVQVGHVLNRAASTSLGTAHAYSSSETGRTTRETKMGVQTESGRFVDAQVYVKLSQTGGTSPTLTWVGMLYEDLRSENNF